VRPSIRRRCSRNARSGPLRSIDGGAISLSCASLATGLGCYRYPTPDDNPVTFGRSASAQENTFPATARAAKLPFNGCSQTAAASRFVVPQTTGSRQTITIAPFSLVLVASPARLSGLVRHLIGATRMTAVACQLNGVTRIMAVRTAIFFAHWGLTVASRVRALSGFRHVSSFLVDAPRRRYDRPCMSAPLLYGP
jgi:hypothetical protein